MKIQEELKSRLLGELDFVIRKVNEEPDVPRKLYFLSAAHGAIQRTMRFHLEPKLLIAHAIMNSCYLMLLDRFNRVRGGDVTVQLPEDWPKKIVEYLTELRKSIKENQPIYPALEKMILLAYSTTGPGYYTKSYLESLIATTET